MWIGILAYSLAFAILSSLAVGKKNRDKFAWFGIGLLFGVFGLIAALIVEDVPSETVDDNVAPCPGTFNPDAFVKKCPSCAESIKLEARVCRFCQHKFSDDDIRDAVETARVEFERNARLIEKLH